MSTDTVTSFSLAGGIGGFLTWTKKLFWVKTVPVPRNVPVELLNIAKSPGTGIVPSGWDVTLNVFVPVANRVGGFGILFAFLKKNAPITSPQLSEINVVLVTVATAPHYLPVNFAPLIKYPKYFSLLASPITSVLNNLDVAE